MRDFDEMKAYTARQLEINKEVVDALLSMECMDEINAGTGRCIDNSLEVLDRHSDALFVYGFVVSTDTAVGTRVTEHCWNEMDGKIVDTTYIIGHTFDSPFLEMFYRHEYFAVRSYTWDEVDQELGYNVGKTLQRNKNVREVINEAKVLAQKEAEIFGWRVNVRRFVTRKQLPCYTQEQMLSTTS